jgi:4-hydroxy-3-polyprenylbenzoate decarboxylase
MRLIVGITGASGIRLSVRLLEELNKRGIELYTIVSENAKKVASSEEDKDILSKIMGLSKTVYNEDDMEAPIASSSYITDGMVIIPCTMNTLAKISYGISDNLILRAADIQIKMKNKLIVVPRESPLSQIHLRNLYRISRIENVYIVFPLLTYYHRPKSIEDMENFTIGKIMDILGIEHKLYKRWGGG